MTWVVILWCVLILAWAIGGAISGANHNAQTCTHSAFLGTKSCEEASNAGTGIGIALILFIGFIGFVFFSLIWFMTRPKQRDCPVCGNSVKKGITTCAKCNHDFAKAAYAVEG
jgi:hypothetical protein